MKVVAFVGPKGAGKDTCADILAEQKKLNKKKISFAMPMKRICSEVFDIPLNFFADAEFKEKDLKEPVDLNVKHLRKIKDLMVTYVDPYEEYYNLNRATDKLVGTRFTKPRQILQVIGTEFIRDEIHENWHCMAAFGEKNLSKIFGTSRNIVVGVTDCRFPNEFDYLSKRFGEDVSWFYVSRPEAEEHLAKATHRSETEILKVKEKILQAGGSTIENSGDIERLTNLLNDVKLPKADKPGKQGRPAKGSRFKFVQRG